MATTVIDLRVARYDIHVTQGKTFDHDLVYADKDLSSYGGTLIVKDVGLSTVFTLSTGATSIVISYSDPDSTVNLLKSAAGMGTVMAGRYSYDLELSSGGTVDPTLCLQGYFVVESEVSS